MISCTCMIQEDQKAAGLREELGEMLDGYARQTFGQSMATTWVLVPAGNGFTAGRASTSSIVSVTSSEPLEQDRRAGLLKTLCDRWMATTGCSLDEIVAVLSDPRSA